MGEGFRRLINAKLRFEIKVSQPTLRGQKGERTCLVHHIDNGLGIAPLVANGHADHSRESCLDFVPKEGACYDFLTAEVDGVGQAVVVVWANQVLQIGAANRTLCCDII